MSKKALIIIGLILTLTAIPLGVYLVKQRQDIRKKASTPSGVVTVRLDPASGNYAIDQNFSVNIKVDLQEINISGIQTYLQYGYTGETPAIEVQDADPNIPGIQIQTGIPALTYVDNTVTVDSVNKTVTIGLTAYSTAGYTSPSEVTFGTINFKALAASNQIIVNFNATASKVIEKETGQDILLTPTSEGSYTIGGEPVATATPTEPAATTTPTQPAATATPTEPAGATNTPTPTATTPPGQPTSTPTSTSTPTPTTGGGATTTTTSVSLTSIVSGQTTAGQPIFSGGAAPGAKITITIQSDLVTGTVYADAGGSWTWMPPSELGAGTHTATITATDSSGNVTTTSANFVVAHGEDLPETGLIIPTALTLLSGLLLLFLGLVL